MRMGHRGAAAPWRLLAIAFAGLLVGCAGPRAMNEDMQAPRPRPWTDAARTEANLDALADLRVATYNVSLYAEVPDGVRQAPPPSPERPPLVESRTSFLPGANREAAARPEHTRDCAAAPLLCFPMVAAGLEPATPTM